MAVELVKKLSLQVDEGQISADLCKPEHSLLDLLGDYLNDERQSSGVKEQIVTTFCNICAEVNENLKEAIIHRGRILAFFSEAVNISDDVIQMVSWLLFNLYCQHVTLLLDCEEVFEKCLLILDRSLRQLLPKMAQQDKTGMVSYFSYTVRYF